MFNIQEIKKYPDGLVFEQKLDLSSSLKERNADILDVQHIVAIGRVTYENEFYFLNYELSYEITLASSRSLKPVLLNESYPVNEVFIEASQVANKKDLVEDDLVLVLEQDQIDLAESVADYILLHIPLKVLTPEEEKGESLPTGQDWAVMTEEEYEQAQQQKKEENSPFASLQGLFEQD